MHLLKFIRFVKVRNFPTGENVIDILEEGLLHNLCVCEQKHCGLVLNTGLVVQLADVCRVMHVHVHAARCYMYMKVHGATCKLCIWLLFSSKIRRKDSGLAVLNEVV